MSNPPVHLVSEGEWNSKWREPPPSIHPPLDGEVQRCNSILKVLPVTSSTQGWSTVDPKAECPERPLKLLGSTGLFQPSQNLCRARGYQNHDMHSVSSRSQWPAPFSKALLQEGNGASESCHSNVGICQDWHEGTDRRHISKFRIVLNHATCEMCSVDASDVFRWVYKWADEHFNFNWFLHIFQSWLWSVSSSRWCSNIMNTKASCPLQLVATVSSHSPELRQNMLPMTLDWKKFLRNHRIKVLAVRMQLENCKAGAEKNG